MNNGILRRCFICTVLCNKYGIDYGFSFKSIRLIEIDLFTKKNCLVWFPKDLARAMNAFEYCLHIIFNSE